MILQRPIVTFPPLAWGQWTDGILYKTERCIEIPLASHLMQFYQPGTILDAGCAMNGTMSPAPVACVTHLTQSLSSEHQYPAKTRHYVEGDLRKLDFPDQAFDRVGCVSTLEHVGCDNTVYGGPAESDPASVVDAVQELWRVTKGRLFLTMPIRQTGMRRDGWRYFTPKTLEAEILQHLPTADVVYYRHHQDEHHEDGYWSGPYPELQVVPHDVGGERVRQMVAILVER